MVKAIKENKENVVLKVLKVKLVHKVHLAIKDKQVYAETKVIKVQQAH